MTDDQVLGNVMLSTLMLTQPFEFRSLRGFYRHQFLGIIVEEELAKCQVAAHQEHDGQAYSHILISYCGQDEEILGVGPEVERHIWYHNAKHEAPHACTNGFGVGKPIGS